MSIKRNVVANYSSQIYITTLAIIVVPTYLRYMGPEAFGLVGFFGVMQGWLQLMDMGLTGTLSREVASCRAGGVTEDQLNALLRSLVALFIAVAFCVAIIVWLSSGLIASSWLQADSLRTGLVAKCISLMGVAAVLRWITGLYRGIIAGSEKQVWLGGYNIASATIRFGGIIPVFIWVGTDPLIFFTYQLIVAIAELVTLWWKSGMLWSGVRSYPCFGFGPLKAMWHFSGALAFSSVVWVFVTQTDKLILSKTLGLIDYGYFTIAMMLASGVSLLANPISGALLPRLTFLATKKSIVEFYNLYCRATQWISIIVWPAAGMAAFFAEPLLNAWTGDAMLAKNASPILFWYALGNACLGVAAFQYYMQFAHGKLMLHMAGNVVFVAVLVPSVVWASINYGAVGAGRVWFAENLVFLLIWTWIVHRRFAPGIHFRWISKDVLPIAVCAIGVSWCLSKTVSLPKERLYVIGVLILLGMVTVSAAVLASSVARKRLMAVLVI